MESSITSTYPIIQIDGTTLRSPLMEQITNCILMEYQYKQSSGTNPIETLQIAFFWAMDQSTGIH
jgi:hypothetical protein